MNDIENRYSWELRLEDVIRLGIDELMFEKEGISRWLRERSFHDNTVLVDARPELAWGAVSQWVYSRGVDANKGPEPEKGRRGCAWVLPTSEHRALLTAQNRLSGRPVGSELSLAESTGLQARDSSKWLSLKEWPGPDWSEDDTADGDNDWLVYGSATHREFCDYAERVRKLYEKGWFGVRQQVCLNATSAEGVRGLLSAEESNCPLLDKHLCGYWAQQKKPGGFKCKIFGTASLRGKNVYDGPVVVIDTDELPPGTSVLRLVYLKALRDALLSPPWSDVFSRIVEWCQSKELRGELVMRLVAAVHGLEEALARDPFEPPSVAEPLPNCYELLSALRADLGRLRGTDDVPPLTWLDKRGDGVVFSRPLRLEAGRRYMLTSRAHAAYREHLEKLDYSFATPGEIWDRVLEEEEASALGNRKRKIRLEDAQRAARELAAVESKVNASSVASHLDVSPSTVSRLLDRESMKVEQLLWPTYEEVRARLRQDD